MSQLVETYQLSFTNTGDSYATFGLDISSTGSGVQKIMVKTSADVYIDFDKVVDTSQSFKVLSANSTESVFDFRGGSVIKLHAKGVSGSGTLYIVAIRS